MNFRPVRRMAFAFLGCLIALAAFGLRSHAASDASLALWGVGFIVAALLFLCASLGQSARSTFRRLLLGVFVGALLTVGFGAFAQEGGEEPRDDPTGEVANEPSGEETGTGEEAALKHRLRDLHEVDMKAPPPAEGTLRTKTSLFDRLFGVLGLLTILGIAYLMSRDRQAIDWRLVAYGLGLQAIFAVLVLNTGAGEAFFGFVNQVFVKLLQFTDAGATFIFGNLTQNNVPVGTPVTYPPEATPVIPPNQTGWANTGAFFAFSVLPTIIFFSSLMSVLYHVGVMQQAVRGVAWVMFRTMKTSGAESLCAAGNIFVGQTEAPLLVRPFLSKMTESELMTVMTGGFATVAGGVLAAYVGMLVGRFPDIAGHLLAASVMSAPAALVLGKMIVPETEEPDTKKGVPEGLDSDKVNVIDAAASGAGDGLKLALNVGAMLLAFIALIHALNYVIGLGGEGGEWVYGAIVGREVEWGTLTLEAILGWALSPLAFLMGVPWEDATNVGSLLGIKTILNEFVAYVKLAEWMPDVSVTTEAARAAVADGERLLIHPRSRIIAAYALCGFANFSSIAIQLGGMGPIAPNRKKDLAKLGFRAMIAGNLAAFMTGTIAGILL